VRASVVRCPTCGAPAYHGGVCRYCQTPLDPPSEAAAPPPPVGQTYYPLSFGGSAKWLWSHLARGEGWVKFLGAIAALYAIAFAWCSIVCWYGLRLALQGLSRLTHVQVFEKALDGAVARPWYGFVAGAIVFFVIALIVG
jgi:hypothetical protein